MLMSLFVAFLAAMTQWLGKKDTLCQEGRNKGVRVCCTTRRKTRIDVGKRRGDYVVPSIAWNIESFPVIG